MFAGKKSAQIREILISESAWEEMTCLFAPSLGGVIFGAIGGFIGGAVSGIALGWEQTVKYIADSYTSALDGTFTPWA